MHACHLSAFVGLCMHVTFLLSGEILPFTDDDLQLLEMFGTLVGPRLERSEFGLRATGGRSVTEAGRANNPPAIERR